ncbi:hypothetical protein Mapa_008650 [Marchantia paleacea]|nr:hypothetical protein Mapa_008650 [Marchantia paleacea]
MNVWLLSWCMQPVPPHALGAGVSVVSGLVLEIVLTFSLVFVIYATAVDPKKGPSESSHLWPSFSPCWPTIQGCAIHWCFHEPRETFRPCTHQLVLGIPLGVLGRSIDWSCHRWTGLRRSFHLHCNPRGR